MKVEIISAYIALIGVLSTALLGLYWNFVSSRAARKQPFLLKQLELCHEVSLNAARLATLHGREEWNVARQRFWELFWGPFSIVEDKEVLLAMERFGEQLQELGESPDLPAGILSGHSYDLARKIRLLILKSWKIDDLGREI